jgi:hypothetical protein
MVQAVAAHEAEQVFTIVKDTEDLIVLGIKDLDPLGIAMHPYLSSDYRYISVTKGHDHTLSVIRKDGTKFSFSWGFSGFTLISQALKNLQSAVIAFIRDSAVRMD